MSLWCWIPYVERQIELGKMTREEGNALLNDIAEIDQRQDELDREFFNNCSKTYIYSGSVLTKEEIDAIYELAKTPIDIDEETINKFNSVGCTSFMLTPEQIKELKEKQ